MLLLVIHPQLDELGEPGIPLGVVLPAQKLTHRGVHVASVFHHLRHRGSRHVAALFAAVTLAGLHVIGVEQVIVSRVERLVAGQPLREHEGLPEPGCVRQVPFCWTHLVHGLDDEVLGGETLGQSLGGCPNRPVSGSEIRRSSWRRFRTPDVGFEIGSRRPLRPPCSGLDRFRSRHQRLPLVMSHWDVHSARMFCIMPRSSCSRLREFSRSGAKELPPTDSWRIAGRIQSHLAVTKRRSWAPAFPTRLRCSPELFRSSVSFMRAECSAKGSSPLAGARWTYRPFGPSCHASWLSASARSRIRTRRWRRAGSSIGATASTRESRLRLRQSALPMKISGSPAFSK